MQLEPQSDFVIVRQLKDPQDTGTYYVRAYIRKSLDDTLLATVDLTNAGSQRFKYTYHLPADPSGEGMYIDITTRVFTDSGYTTESDYYQKENFQYLIKKMYNPVYGGGGGGSIDYKKVREIVKEEIDRLPKIEIPPQKEVDLKPILEAIDGIEVSPIIKTEKVELGGIIRLIEGVRMKVEGLPKPKEPEKVDFSGIYNRIDETLKQLNLLWGENKELLDDDRKKIEAIITKLVEQIKEKTFIALNSVEEKPKNEKSWRKTY